MDPNLALFDLRQLVKKSQTEHLSSAEIERIAELFTALDGWLSREGFLPFDWRKART